MAQAPKRPSGPNDWIDLPLDKGLYKNLDPDQVSQFQTAIENGFVNELGGHTRFPGLQTFATLKDNGRVYLSDFEGDLIAATSQGQVYRVDPATADVTQCTGVPVSGGRRVIMAPTNQEMIFAAGGPLVRLRKTTTEVLSNDAPNAAYVGYIDGYIVAPQVDSQAVFYCDPGEPTSWPALNTFSADSNADNINCMLIDPFRELILGGARKFEQWERFTTGDTPFFRRWAIGDGAKLAYGIVFADNTLWTINQLIELVRFEAQISTNMGNEVGLLLESIDDWTDAWIGGFPDRPLNVIGQKFILLQAPNATNDYGTKGVTLVFDYRAKKFFSLYGWDNQKGVPTRWPGWSHWTLNGNVYVGGQGVIYLLTPDTYQNGGNLQRWLVRTSHIAQGDMFQINDFRLFIKRGMVAPNLPTPTIRIRARRDAKQWGPWVTRDLGVTGDNLQMRNFGPFGTASTFMFEISSADNVPIELKKAQVRGMEVTH